MWSETPIRDTSCCDYPLTGSLICVLDHAGLFLFEDAEQALLSCLDLKAACQAHYEEVEDDWHAHVSGYGVHVGELLFMEETMDVLGDPVNVSRAPAACRLPPLTFRSVTLHRRLLSSGKTLRRTATSSSPTRSVSCSASRSLTAWTSRGRALRYLAWCSRPGAPPPWPFPPTASAQPLMSWPRFAGRTITRSEGGPPLPLPPAPTAYTRKGFEGTERRVKSAGRPASCAEVPRVLLRLIRPRIANTPVCPLVHRCCLSRPRFTLLGVSTESRCPES